MPLVGFEPSIPASARPQTYALERAATGIGKCIILSNSNVINKKAGGSLLELLLTE
jgi:hypothetical protein